MIRPLRALVPAGAHALEAIFEAAANQTRRLRVAWVDDQTVEVGGTRFSVRYALEDLHSIPSTPEQFLLAKSPSLISDLLDIAPRQVRHIVDLGIFKGGSAAFYALVFRPTRLVAIDITEDPVPALKHFIATNEHGHRIRPYYGIDQADHEALTSILRTNFPDRSLDLVVDDCSHRYASTKASFNCLFGWLRPGGVYIIEDWGWAHWSGETWQGPDGPFSPDEPALSNLVFEISMLSASRPDLLAEVRVTSGALALRRGYGEIDDDFDISSAYLTRGRGFEPVV